MNSPIQTTGNATLERDKYMTLGYSIRNIMLKVIYTDPVVKDIFLQRIDECIPLISMSFNDSNNSIFLKVKKTEIKKRYGYNKCIKDIIEEYLPVIFKWLFMQFRAQIIMGIAEGCPQYDKYEVYGMLMENNMLLNFIFNVCSIDDSKFIIYL